jgi:hypothetical protein
MGNNASTPIADEVRPPSRSTPSPPEDLHYTETYKPWSSQCCPCVFTFLHDKKTYKLDVQTGRQWANMRAFLEFRGVDLNLLRNGKLIMVWGDGRILWPSDWAGVIL